jgi:hypothetical protein
MSNPTAPRIAHIEVYEGEYIIAHDLITDDYTIDDIREDYSGATVVEGCNCRNALKEATAG